jgi:hypothetical protein
VPAAASTRVEPHRHRIEHFVADHHTLEAVRQGVQPGDAPGQMRGPLVQRGLLARAQFGQFDDLVGVWQRILGFEREQQVGGQPAGACAEFHDARQVHSDQRRELARQRAGEERRQFGAVMKSLPSLTSRPNLAAPPL